MADQQPQRFPLVVQPTNRDQTTNRDARIINAFVEQVSEQDVRVYKRPCLKYSSTPAASQIGRGVYNWNSNIFSIFGNKLYKNGVAVSGTVDTTNGSYDWNQVLGSVPKLFFTNAIKAYLYDDTNGLVEIPAQFSVNVTGDLATGTNTIKNIDPDTTGMLAGMVVAGTGIPTGALIATVDSSTQITLTVNATATTTAAAVNVQNYGIPTKSQPFIKAIKGDITSSSAIITNVVTSTSGMLPGMSVVGTGIPAGVTVVSVDSGSQITVSDNATATTAGLDITVSDNGVTSLRVKGSAYLDGTLYVTTTLANVYGSDINDPMKWDPLNMLVAQTEPDDAVFTAKQLVYVIVFGQWSTEAFYDAGNATGSPLGPVQGAKVSVGCRHADTVQELEGTLFWVSQARGGSIAVFAMDGMKAQQISTPPVERLLEEGDYSEVYSWTARLSGHKYYGITLKNSNLTLVYDLISHRWYQWTDTNGNYFPIVAATYNSSQQVLMQHATNGKIYTLEDMTYVDDGQLISVEIYTPNYDGGVRFRKYMKSMDVVADQTTGSLLQIRKSDDDYQTWSNFRTVDLGRIRPRLTDNGTFRRRAYHVVHRCNTPLRLVALEMWVDPGTL